MLDDLGLVPTLRWFINKISKRANMEVKFETMRMDERLEPNIETILGAIIMLVVALLINNIPKSRRYPEFWI